MFKRMIWTYLLLAMTAVGTGTMTRLAESAPVVQMERGRQLPAAPAIPVPGNNIPSTPLSANQMSSLQGQGPWGWLKKIWKKHKKTILKIIWEVIKIIWETVTTETNSYVEGVSGEVVETYEGEDETQNVYNSQSDYDTNNVASTSYADYGYAYQGSDYSGGSYEY